MKTNHRRGLTLIEIIVVIALSWAMREGEPVVVSYGADGAPGGEGDAEDITSLDAE